MRLTAAVIYDMSAEAQREGRTTLTFTRHQWRAVRRLLWREFGRIVDWPTDTDRLVGMHVRIEDA